MTDVLTQLPPKVYRTAVAQAKPNHAVVTRRRTKRHRSRTRKHNRGATVLPAELVCLGDFR